MFGKKMIPAIALVAGLSVVPAAAQPLLIEGELPPTVVMVGYSDLNLASAGGRSALTARVRGAAKRLCLGNGPAPLRIKMDGVRCFTEAISGANTQIQQAVADFGTSRYASRGAIQVAARK